MSEQDSKFGKFVEAVKAKVETEISKPFIVSIMGQTGVGKSSLVNALFNVNLPTDPVRPCTNTVERIVVKDRQGHELWFYDLPGIGETGNVNESYLETYSQHLKKSDVTLWAIHIDNRSVAYDQQALQQLMQHYDEEEKAQMMSKITFVLTKSDLLSLSPWIFAYEGKYGVFVPDDNTNTILAQKASFYQESFLVPYKHLITSKTYNDSNFDVQHPLIQHDKYTVWYKGYMDEQTLIRLKQLYPKHSDIFNRLFSNYQVIACSALFRYNLSQLMLVIMNKLGRKAIGRFTKFTSEEALNKVPLKVAKEYCNIVAFNRRKGQVVFDLTTLEL